MINIVLPDSITYIGNDAFISTNIKKLNIPKNLENIDPTNPFDAPLTLESIYTPDDAVKFRTFDGVLFSKDMKTLISYPSSRKEWRYAIPNDVDNLFHGAFNNPLYLHSIIIQKPTTSLSEQNFVNFGANLTSVFVIRSIKDQTILSYTGHPFVHTDFQISDVKYITLDEYLRIYCRTKLCTYSHFYYIHYSILVILFVINID